ncbi:MAG: DUF2339 domain-containing protein [Thermodesulfobacteriota bacterium]
MYAFGSLWIFIVLFILAGSICGIVALKKVKRLFRDLEGLKKQLRSLESRLKEPEVPTPTVKKEILTEEPLPSVGLSAGATDSLDLPPSQPAPEAHQVPPLLERESIPSPPSTPGASPLSLEMKLGTKWLNWVGIVMLLVGIGFFLKYAYDNAWIGPKGRLAIGILFGLVALGLGERFKRRDWSVLFQVLTGGGLATFYLCIYFSFQVYRISDQTISMILAILVTALAVVIAVANNAVPIAIMALIGGFLSPVLLSTGVNRPYAFFTYIAILDMVAMGAAYFRRWRILDLLCFAGTAVMYFGWHEKFYRSDQMAPALIYTSLFYLMFLLIPTLHSLVRRLPETPEGLAIVLLNAGLSLLSYYDVLFPDNRYVLGFVILEQAALVFLLFHVWTKRVGIDSRISVSFLAITLGLVTLAIPIQMKLYGIPIAWAMEGAVFIYLGIRFRQILCEIAGGVAFILAVVGLLCRLPLHKVLFTPVFNVPFGSWSCVVAATAISAYLLHRDKESEDPWRNFLTVSSFLLSLSLACSLLSMELAQLWKVNYRIAHYRTYESSSLVILWSLIPTAIACVLVNKKSKAWVPLPGICFVIGVIILFTGLTNDRYPSPWLFLNAAFLPRLVLVISLWYTARLYRRLDLKIEPDVHSLAGHGILALLVAFEFARWGGHSHLITPKMSISLISAAWAVHAFVVIWIGLAKRNQLLRYLGFVLFFLTIGKTLIIDMSELEKVYRIVSFAASGILLVSAGYFYQRYSSRLLERPEPGTSS